MSLSLLGVGARTQESCQACETIWDINWPGGRRQIIRATDTCTGPTATNYLRGKRRKGTVKTANKEAAKRSEWEMLWGKLRTACLAKFPNDSIEPWFRRLLRIISKTRTHSVLKKPSHDLPIVSVGAVATPLFMGFGGVVEFSMLTHLTQ